MLLKSAKVFLNQTLVQPLLLFSGIDSLANRAGSQEEVMLRGVPEFYNWTMVENKKKTLQTHPSWNEKPCVVRSGHLVTKIQRCMTMRRKDFMWETWWCHVRVPVPKWHHLVLSISLRQGEAQSVFVSRILHGAQIQSWQTAFPDVEFLMLIPTCPENSPVFSLLQFTFPQAQIQKMQYRNCKRPSVVTWQNNDDIFYCSCQF